MRTNRNKLNPWTSALLAAGVIGAGSAAQAEEAGNYVATALSSTTISGYVDTSAIWAVDQTGAMRLPGRTYTGPDKQNGFNLNLVDLVIEKPVDESSWGAGYRAELLFGPDAKRLGSNTMLGFKDDSDLAIKNAYVSLRAPVGNGINFKVGLWDTIVGYEVFAAGANPNYSRSYAFFIEPFVHTGVLASYDVNDILSINFGVANNGFGSDLANGAAAPDPIGGTVTTPPPAPGTTVTLPGRGGNMINYRGADNGELTYLGSVSLTAPESAGALEGAQLTGGIVYNPQSGGFQDFYNFYAGASLPLPVTGLSLGAAYDYLGGQDTMHANAFGGYLVFQATEKLLLAGRVEYANGSSGTWGTAGKPDGDEFLGVTATIDYSLWANTITRLEFRWDRDLADGPKAFGTAANPAEDAYMLALNVIYNF
ncbi:MAG: outer membrane beta-barrel protein [Verrucomicrobiales bacterium]|nr:outer membrane beta-barrel protein [Verrucomicrobiales bacterium]